MRLRLECKFVSIVLCVHSVWSIFTPAVQLEQGRVRGLRSISGQNRYYSLPYATAQRFQAPQPAQNWSGLLPAVRRFDTCSQNIASFKLGHEDCLQLDVYTPETARRGHNLPVFVFFHGGGYYYGAKWHYDPEFLVTKNVTAVIVNYRVGVFGFLCLNDVANLGLKDQTAALIWIRKNIAAFGGDQDNVIISGQSAGASAAAMHMLSKKSIGLFHKAILMSGVALTPWAFNLVPLTAAFEDAAKLGPVRNISEVYNMFLKSAVNDILTATEGTSIDPKYFKYAPCVDSNHSDPFFHDTPYNTITSGYFNEVPVIIGFADLEGLLFYGLNEQDTLNNLDKTFTESLPSVFSWCSQKDKRKIANKIRAHYFGERKINSKESIKGVIDFYSDFLVYGSSEAFSQLLAKYSDKPVFNYMLSYEGDRSYSKAIFNKGVQLRGATHSDDLFYMFKPGGLSFVINEADRLFIDRFTTLLTNFMKYGDPTPFPSAPLKWLPTSRSSSHVLHLDRQLSLSAPPPRVRGEFFRSLLCTYGQQGYVPCDSQMQCNIENG